MSQWRAAEIDEEQPSPLVITGQPSWDGAPGGREPYVEQVASLLVDLEGGRVHPAHRPLTCTIPTISALDLDSALDAPVPATAGLITCQTDQLHVHIDAPAAARVLAELGAPFDPDWLTRTIPAFSRTPSRRMPVSANSPRCIRSPPTKACGASVPRSAAPFWKTPTRG